MNIIRDQEEITPILIELEISYCGMLGCTDKPNTMITDIIPGVPPAFLCEKHYQIAKSEQEIRYFLNEYG